LKNDLIDHQRDALLSSESMIMGKCVKCAACHDISKVVRVVEFSDQSRQSPADAKVAGLPCHSLVQSDQSRGSPCDCSLVGVGKRAGLKVDITSKVEAQLNWGSNLRHNSEPSHRFLRTCLFEPFPSSWADWWHNESGSTRQEP
jgi:L-lactate utilization protein LutB